jgi:hypothetical protein
MLGVSTAAFASPSVWHVHLALSSDPTQMHVQWTSVEAPASDAKAIVQFGLSAGGLTQSATGYSWTYLDAGQRRTYYFSQASMTGLSPGTTYYYRVGDGESTWSAVSSFTATRTAAQMAAPQRPLTIAFLGDLGYANGQATPFLVNASAAQQYDHYVHVGDYAYDLPTANGTNGDLFETSIEPITAAAPYMGCEGNHEGGGGFGHYSNRFAVFAGDNSSGATPPIPGLDPQGSQWNNHWYSYNVGLVHFVAMSSEAYFFYNGKELQYAWLEADLKAVDRQKTPWVVVYGHRSIYCSCDGDCDGAATALRDGPLGMEGLLNRYKVDLWINAHEHDYERNYAVINHTLATGASSGKPGGNAQSPEVLTNPTAPIYIIEGCAGDSEGHEPFTRPQPEYSAYRSNTYGFGRM